MQEVINNLTMNVEVVSEDDQTAVNFAVITEVIVNFSAITAKGAVPLQEQLNVNVISVLARLHDKIQMYILARTQARSQMCTTGSRCKSQCNTGTCE